MQNEKIMNNSVCEESINHMFFHHQYKSLGWITLAQKGSDGSWRQYHYQSHQLRGELNDWQGENIYFSQNTFYKPQRRIETIKQLRALYVDIDCYNLGYNPHWVAEKLKLEVFHEQLPLPNLIIFSGRGLICTWLIEPVPSQALPLWKAIQNFFYKKMEYVGADKKCMDPTRVFRLAGSINSTNQKKVDVEYLHDYRYELRELQADYLPELSSNRRKRSDSSANIIYMHNLHNLHYARLMDIVKIAELRDFDLRGNRELFCFLYRYWSCCFTADESESLAQMLEFNKQFKEPLSKSEVVRATASAEKAWNAKNDNKANEEAIAKGYPGAGYNIKNQTIIQWLDISEDEQTHLKTIIGEDEKRRRKRKRDKEAFRKKNGSSSRDEYLEKESEKTDNMIWQLKRAIETYPKLSNLKLAELLAVSESYIRKLKLKLEF